MRATSMAVRCPTTPSATSSSRQVSGVPFRLEPGCRDPTWTRSSKAPNLATCPVEQPSKFELVINQKAAKQIGLVMPASVLARADRVIR